MKTYIGAKIIQAEPMDQATFITTIKQESYVNPPGTNPPDGYHVLYPDGYHSWSPKFVFEEAYREISVGEQSLMGIS